MRCPFLREEQVRSCQAAPFRKSLARTVAVAAERCTSPDHTSCPMLRQSHEAHPNPTRCPFLSEALAQFCAAVPRTTYVPWSASPEQRCLHDGHRFCSVFLDACGADARRPAGIASDAPEGRTEVVAGVPMPAWLSYAGSHLWLDAADDGIGHVGVDAFVTQLLGRIEGLAFVAVKGTAQPAVLLSVRGGQVSLRFPRALPILAANLRLRARLDRLTEDPYGSGWLFETRLPADVTELPLRRGPAAREWMASEVRHVTAWLHRHLHGTGFAADGGRFAAGLLGQLAPADAAQLLAAAFPSPDAQNTDARSTP